jgi:uncharacterized protein YndB with AHSA1/START domain
MRLSKRWWIQHRAWRSTAATVVLGRSANGRVVEWKGADGRTLKEIQTAEAAQ